jgi:hypothetical protein
MFEGRRSYLNLIILRGVIVAIAKYDKKAPEEIPELREIYRRKQCF